jgi:hypothetical protein
MIAAKLPDGTGQRATEIAVAVRALLAERVARAGAGDAAVAEHYAQQAALLLLLRSWVAGVSAAELVAVSLLANELKQ